MALQDRAIEGGTLKPRIPVIPDDEEALPVRSREGETINVKTEAGDKVDVSIQDQTTPAFDAYFGEAQTPTTLAANVSVGDTTITLAGGHGVSAGQGLLLVNATAFFCKATNVVANTITIDTPASVAFTSGDDVLVSNLNLGTANGSLASPVVYEVVLPAIGLQLDVTRIMIQMITSSASTLPLFGDQGALTNGIVLRRVPATPTVSNPIIAYWNIKTNAEFGLHAYDLTFYQAGGPPGQNGLSVRSTFAGQDKRGVAVRLSAGDSLQVLVQDNLTGLDTFFVMAQGHVVDP